MRHGKKFNHLGRTAPHRKAMLSNMASSLILNKRITTTVAKAKALRQYVEPLLTKAKNDTTHSRRVVFSYLNNKYSVQALFDDVAQKIAERPGGYTRILKTGRRLGDSAEMCIIELVDYNELMLAESKPKKSKTRRSRRGGGKKAEGEAVQPQTKAEAVATEAEEPVEEATPPAEEEPEATVEAATEEVQEVAAVEAEAQVEEKTIEPKAESTEAEEEEKEADEAKDEQDKKEKE